MNEEQFESIELKISKFLRGGVMVSGLFIAIGWLWSFKAASNPFERLQEYSSLTLVQSIKVNILLQRWGHLVSYFGLLILISLPVIRVLLSTVLLLKQKEKLMAAVGLIVLLGLILSFSLGIEH